MDKTKPTKKSSHSTGKLKRVDSKETATNIELKARYERLLNDNDKLDREIKELERDGANEDLQPQMEALHEYNEMKDVAQMVLGYLADLENVTVKELHQRFELPME